MNVGVKSDEEKLREGVGEVQEEEELEEITMDEMGNALKHMKKKGNQQVMVVFPFSNSLEQERFRR